MTVYLPKSRRGLQLTFVAHFLHDKSKNILYLILYQLTKFQCHTFFPFQDIKQNVLLNSHLDNFDKVINFKACVCYFLLKYFSLNDSPSKTMKNVFYLIWNALLCSRDIQMFVFPSSSLFWLSAIALEVDQR